MAPLARAVASSGIALLAAACATGPRLDIGPTPPGVSADARIVYYDVTPTTLGEMRRAMMTTGPEIDGRRWEGETTWHLSWRWDYDSRGLLGCSLRRVRVLVDAQVQLPRWMPDDAVDAATVAQWQRMAARLEEHERGHVLLAVDAARELARTLEGQMGGRCDALGMSANAIGQRTVATLNLREAEYDRRTAHGGRQELDSVRPSSSSPSP